MKWLKFEENMFQEEQINNSLLNKESDIGRIDDQYVKGRVEKKKGRIHTKYLKGGIFDEHDQERTKKKD